MSNTYNWHDIQRRAAQFGAKWITETNEKAESKTFWDDFLREIFNIERRKYMSFEKTSLRANTNRKGFIDLFWKGKFLVEHKAGTKNSDKDFDEAFSQALDYVNGLPQDARPRYVVLCNFQRFRMFDAQTKKTTDFGTDDLHLNIKLFQFIPDAVNETIEREVTANVEAAELMGRLHDAVEKDGYKGRDLELLLVRLLFCVFAEDTEIFTEKIFTKLVNDNLKDDGKSLGKTIAQLFDLLNLPYDDRPADTPKHLRLFPYVNGGLFERPLSKIPNFTMFTLQALHKCCLSDWSAISPAIFGSLFQSVMNAKERRNLGAHYTSEDNISRLIDPLFMEALWKEFEEVKENTKKLEAFHVKLGKLRFFDPACGCGNFLVVTFKDMRLLELEVLKILKQGQLVTNLEGLVNVKIQNFYGIEIEESSFLIAQTAMWLADHQSNRLFAEKLGGYIPSVPLPKGANIKHGNSLKMDWQTAFPNMDYIIGNPPFIGSKMMSEEQRDQIKSLFGNTTGSGVLDYVTGWYKKAAIYMDKYPSVRTAFVSTNSIAQGEQVGILWSDLYQNHNIQHLFGHQTFKWNNEATGVAAVHCVIVGFAQNADGFEKAIFEYADIAGQPTKSVVKNLNAYLVEGKSVFVMSRQKPLCAVPEIGIGNKPIDGGHYLFTTEERDAFLIREPKAKAYFRRWIGSDEFINGYERWCLWLGEEKEDVLKKIPLIWERVEAVRDVRLESKSPPTQKLAEKPTRFHVENMPKSNYLVVPEVSSERRPYIPIGYENPATLASNLVKIVPNATLFHFAVLTSKMHMAWVKYVCGRLESRYRYSKDIVYNNYPFPQNVSDAQRKAVEQAAQRVLDERENHEGKSLAKLYDPLSMPPSLLQAHADLDKAVDSCYGKTRFMSDAKRVAFLFERYDELIKAEQAAPKKKK